MLSPGPSTPSTPSSLIPAQASEAEEEITLLPPQESSAAGAGVTPDAPAGPGTPDAEAGADPVLNPGATNALLAFLRAPSTHQPAAVPESPGQVVKQKKYQRRSALQAMLKDLRARGPSWVGSAIGHVFVLLVMAQFVMFIRSPDVMRSIMITLGQADVDKAGETDEPAETDTEPAPAASEAEEETPVEKPAETPEATPKADQPEDAETPEGPAESSEASDAAPPTVSQAFNNRLGTGKSDALRKFGGSAETEAAVERGLQWLARHQQPNGRWSGAQFASRCPRHDQCSGTGWDGYDVAHTSLATLCFLGAGHLPGSKPYGEQVDGGIKFLLSWQQDNGVFGPGRSNNLMYNHCMATLAMCEAVALTNDDNLRAAAQRGINYICSAQQVGGGWDYKGTRFRTNRNDLSIAGWAVMAMKSALVADVKVPRRHWDRARAFVRQSQRSDGEYKYADKGFQGFGGEVRHGPGMTAVGLLCDLYLGAEPGSGELALAARRVAGETPDWDRLMTEELHTAYYWYYGTLAMFQWGGEHWHTWNAAMRPTLLKNQRRGGHADGSWDPDGIWLGKYGGRLYATTFNILNLEIYYRYLPIYRNLGRAPEADPHEIADAQDAIAKTKSKSAGVRFAAVSKLAGEKSKGAFEAITKALRDKNQMVRYTAIKALVKREEPESTALLLEAFATEGRDLRRVIVDSLGKRGDRSAVPALIGALSDADPEVRRRAPRALERLTQERFGADPRAWLRWWSAERRK